MKEKLYLAVTNDKYEFPIAVFDNCKQLSRWAKRSKDSLFSAIKRQSVDKKLHCRYERVEVDEDYERE